MDTYLTPIQKMAFNLNNNELYIKRDDLYPYSFGGNKARKGFLFFNDLLMKEKDAVVTYGSMSSNHCRIIANLSAKHGIKCVVVTPLVADVETFNSQLVKEFNTRIVKTELTCVKETIEEVIKRLEEKGYNPYFIEGGGHGNLGTQAYVNAYGEIKEYEKKYGINFDYIFHTTGTGTTQAGLICGKILNKDNRRIIGISNARNSISGGRVVLDSVNDYLKEKRYPLVTKREVNFIDNYILDGYGSTNKSIFEIIKRVMLTDGIPLDSTYTAKGFWGMEQYILSKNINDCKILFIHTGGSPLFFEDLRRNRIE